MRKIIEFNFIAFMLFVCTTGIAQQLPQFTQYQFNTITINPAYAGSRGVLNFTGVHRSQWVGLDEAPNTQTASLHTPLENEKIGLGFSFINDHVGFENFAYAYADFSYTIQLNARIKLAFGLKGGFTYFNLDSELLNDPDVSADPFFNDAVNRWSPNIGLGTYLHSERWYLGLSSPRILNTDYNQGRNLTGEEFLALERVSYFLTGGYVFDLKPSIKLKPSFLVRAVNGSTLSYDLNANFLFNEKFWLGAAYRINEQTEAIGAIADFQISNQFRIGYGYEYPLSALNSFTGGSHEILLIYEVFKNKRVKSPRYF